MIKRPTIKTADAETRTNAMREIALMLGEINNAIILNGKRNCPYEVLESMGYKRNGNIFEKKGIRFCVNQYNSNYEWYVVWGFYFGVDSYCHLTNIEDRIDEVIARGFKTDYVRPVETELVIENIKKEIEETRKLVNGRGLGKMGGFLRSKGYFVSYDGFSVCNFSKGSIVYSAHCDGRWELTDNFSLYLAEGVRSAEFTLNNTHRTNFNLAEVVLGGKTDFGRRQTEKDLLPTYKKFRVRTYANKYLDTAKWFDNFEDAKKFAYDLAVEKAKSVEGSNRCYAITNPRDRGEDYDMLACYCWYSYRGSANHLVFVQGEN
jgi:hypothetical protein